ncbi:mediator of DNA damage checkpoint protein 1 [Athene noctua]|uniref:mediator of DNA damage checkpoint protein 1 n=1 Tax=Athene noctua TaxID=126797 RepID=UPI003EC02895
MNRRCHQGLSTVGGTAPRMPGSSLGWRPEPGAPLASDSEDDELPWRPALRGAASPRVVPESDPEEPDVHPDVQRPRKRCHAPTWGHLPDVAKPCPDPNVGGPKKRRFGPQAAPDPDVGKKPATPSVQPPNHPPNPGKVAGPDADPDAEHLEGTNTRLDVKRGTAVEVLPKSAFFHSSSCDQAALEISSDTDVEEKGSNPDVGGTKNGCQMLVVDSDTDVEEAEFCPDVERTKIQQMAQNVTKTSGVELEPRNPDVGGPKNGCRTLLGDSDTDVEMESSNSAVEGAQSQMLTVDSDTDVEEDRAYPDVGRSQTHQTTQNVPKSHNIEMETPRADVGGSQKGHRLLVEDSDTDVEEDEANPDVGCSKTHQRTPNIPKSQIITMETQSADVESSQKARDTLVVDSDTDVEENASNPDVVCPKSPGRTPRDPDVKVETINRDVEGRQILLVESDTDVEDDTSSPDVCTLKSHQATQNVPRNPHLETESLNPHVVRPQNNRYTLVVDSDTDVEENEVDPDVERPKSHRTAHRNPDVKIKTSNPDVEEAQNEHQNLEVDSDTDVEENNLSQGVLHLKSHKTPQNTRKDPTVVMETPNPDVGGFSHSSVASSGDRDTDVEDLNPLPDAGAPEPHAAAREVPDPVAKMATAPDVDPKGQTRTNDDPDVKASFPNPDVDTLKAQCPVPNADNDTIAGRNGVVPDVGVVQGCQGTSGDPDVTATPPNPDVPLPMSPQDSSDADVEEVAPTPAVRGLRSRIRFQNHPHPDVASPTPDNDTDADPKRCKLSPKRQDFPPEAERDTDAEKLFPTHPGVAPNPDVEPSPPDVGPQRHSGETPAGGRDPAVPPDVFTPKSPRLDPNRSVGAGGGAGTAGTTGAAVTESDTEDPDLFLEPTQSFLPPVAEGAASSWDPEEPTQRFCPPEEEEEEEQEEQPPPTPPKDSLDIGVPPTVTLAQEGTESRAATGGEMSVRGEPPPNPGTPFPPKVGEGPRRSQRLARSRGGGASGGGASGEGGASRARGGAPSVPAPVRRSPRLQARPPPPSELPVTRGQGQAEPRPPAKPRPRRASPAPSPMQVEEQEKEPPEVTGPQLRPRGVPGSAPPKVLFTGVVASPGMEVALKTLGGSMATSIFDCTHLVTDRVRRTVKFLCAVARGVPIVTPEWLHKSASSGRVLGAGPFLVRDRQQEQHFGFSLAQALRCARRHPLLQGYEVHVTPNVRPEPEQMRDIVTCSGGTFLPTMPDTYGPRRLVISCEADAGCWAPALGARLPLTSAELLLTGLLRQRLQVQSFLLPPPSSHGTPPNLPTAPTAQSGIPHPLPEGSGEAQTRGRNRGPPRDPPGTRRRPAAPPTRQ